MILLSKKTKYRPFSLLSHISRVFERVIYNQMNEYIEPFLCKILPGSRKSHNTHDSLLIILANFKEALDNVNSVSAIFMDTLNHDLLIAKLVVYFFYIHSYLNKRLQKTNVNCDFSLRK